MAVPLIVFAGGVPPETVRTKFTHGHLLASPPSYCVAPICADGACKILSCDHVDVVDGTLCNNEIPTGEFVQYISYVCYVPGDCTNGGVGCDEPGEDLGCTIGDEGCTQAIESLSCTADSDGCRDTLIGFKPPTDKDLNGGWYGRIGNFNLFLDKE